MPHIDRDGDIDGDVTMSFTLPIYNAWGATAKGKLVNASRIQIELKRDKRRAPYSDHKKQTQPEYNVIKKKPDTVSNLSAKQLMNLDVASIIQASHSV